MSGAGRAGSQSGLLPGRARVPSRDPAPRSRTIKVPVRPSQGKRRALLRWRRLLVVTACLRLYRLLELRAGHQGLSRVDWCGLGLRVHGVVAEARCSRHPRTTRRARRVACMPAARRPRRRLPPCLGLLLGQLAFSSPRGPRLARRAAAAACRMAVVSSATRPAPPAAAHVTARACRRWRASATPELPAAPPSHTPGVRISPRLAVNPRH